MRLTLAKFLVNVAEKLGYQHSIETVTITLPSTAKDVVNHILDQPLEWVDWRKMSLDDRKNWGNIARDVLDNRAFVSLLGASKVIHNESTTGEIVKRVMENIARYSKDHTQTENMRHIICGAELIKELLEEMVVHDEKDDVVDDPYATF